MFWVLKRTISLKMFFRVPTTYVWLRNMIVFATNSEGLAVEMIHYTIIDFNEVDIRIYLPEKVIIHQGRYITFKGR